MPGAPGKDGKTLSQAFRRARSFVLLLGLVSLFADMTYEGARSSTGPFLALLGASGAAVGFVAGAGEFLGYGLRFLSGRWADRSHAYWPITLLGYAVNLLAVPALALAGSWQLAALLIILERTGKAIRNPARDAMLGHAAHEVGPGWAYGYHHALDQVGATLGPLLMAGAVFVRGEYRLGFALLSIPAVLAIATLLAARRSYPNPRDLEPAGKPLDGRGLRAPFWLYVAGACLLAAGFADFPLLAYHLGRTATIAPAAIPLLYALAMASSAAAAIALGRAFDAWGPRILVPAALVAIPSAPFVLLGDVPFVVAGAALWGLGLGVQASLFKAVLRDLVPPGRRARAFGAFDGLYGVAWFAGSAAVGVLYDHSVVGAAAGAAVLQAAALPVLYLVTARGAAGARSR